MKSNNIKLECLTPNQKWVKMYRAEIERNGKSGTWEFVSRKETPEIISGESKADAVIIIPFIRKVMREVIFVQDIGTTGGFMVTLDCGHKIATRTKSLRYRCPKCGPRENCFHELLVIKEFRYPIGDYVFSFPAGIIEDNEDPIKAANRELLEETGYQIDKVITVTPPVYSSTGLTDESTIFVYAYVSRLGPPKLEGMEDIEVISMGKVELTKLIQQKAPYEKARISCKLWPIAHDLIFQRWEMI